MFPDTGSSRLEKYNALVTMHGSIMIFWVAMPVLIAAFGNFLIPLMVGCDDMAFPRINRLSYQIFLLSAIVLLSSFLVKGGPFGGAWTAYPPLSASRRLQLDADWRHAVAAGGGAGIRRVFAGRHQLHRHHDEQPRPGHENVRHPAGRLDDRPRQRYLHGFCGTA